MLIKKDTSNILANADKVLRMYEPRNMENHKKSNMLPKIQRLPIQDPINPYLRQMKVSPSKRQVFKKTMDILDIEIQKSMSQMNQ